MHSHFSHACYMAYPYPLWFGQPTTNYETCHYTVFSSPLLLDQVSYFILFHGISGKEKPVLQ